MTKPTFDFNLSADMLCGVAECRALDGPRHYLYGVYVEPAPDPVNAGRGVRMVATDGAIMCVAFDPDGYAARTAMLKLDWKDKNLKTAPREAGKRRITITDEKGVIALAPEGAPDDLDNVLAYAKVEEAEDNFPQYRRVIPHINAMADRPFAQGFSSELIRRIAASAKRMGGASSAMHFTQANSGDPALIRIADMPNAFWVLMPYRFREDTGLPFWLAYEPARQEAAE
jgi:hypothetical protein